MGAARISLAAVVTATALGGLAALHVVWATGATFPVRGRDEFAETFLGVEGLGTPGPGACLAVAGALGAAAGATLARGRAATAGAATTRPTTRLESLGVRGAAAVLAARGLAGLAVSGAGLRRTTARFRILDLSVYSPLCLALAGGLAAVERQAAARS